MNGIDVSQVTGSDVSHMTGSDVSHVTGSDVIFPALFLTRVVAQNVPSVGKQTHDLTVTVSDSKTTQSGGDNRKKFLLGAALQVPQNFSFAPL